MMRGPGRGIPQGTATVPGLPVFGDPDTGIGGDGANGFWIIQGGVKTFALSATGGLTMAVGQIAFPGTQNASTDPNTLDDYEEYTYTPAVTFGASATGVTSSVLMGRGVKVGKIVHNHTQFTLTSNGTVTGNCTITGLGHTSNTVSNVFWGCAPIASNIDLNVAGGYYTVRAGVGSASSTLLLHQQGDNVAASTLTDSEVTDTAAMSIDFSYEAAS